MEPPITPAAVYFKTKSRWIIQANKYAYPKSADSRDVSKTAVGKVFLTLDGFNTKDILEARRFDFREEAVMMWKVAIESGDISAEIIELTPEVLNLDRQKRETVS